MTFSIPFDSRRSFPLIGSSLRLVKQTKHAPQLTAVQRITRYPLLLKQIIHYTDADQDLSLLEQGLRTVETIVGQINESVRENESGERLRALSEDLWIGGEG